MIVVEWRNLLQPLDPSRLASSLVDLRDLATEVLLGVSPPLVLDEPGLEVRRQLLTILLRGLALDQKASETASLVWICRLGMP